MENTEEGAQNPDPEMISFDDFLKMMECMPHLVLESYYLTLPRILV